MLEQILSTVMIILGITLSEVLVSSALGKYKNNFANLFELIFIVIAISFSSGFLESSSFFGRVLISFCAGFFPSLIIKSSVSIYFRRAFPEQFISEKSMIIQLIRSMKLEGVGKKSISKIFSRVNIKVNEYLKFF